MQDYLKKKYVVIIIAIFCSILWGSAFPVLKVSYTEMQMASDDTIAKIVLAGYRFLLAGAILLVGLFFLNRQALRLTRRQTFFIVIFGFIQTAVQYFFFYNGLANTSGIQGAILAASGTFFTVILAHFFYRNDRINRAKVFGLVAGFAGIIIANWGQEFSFNFHFTGEGFMILAALTGAIGTIMAKEMALGIHPFALTGWQLMIGSIIMLAFGMPQISQDAIIFTPLGWGLLLYSALLSAVAFALWYSILKYNKAGEISIYKFITPVSGVILSAIFIPGEALDMFIYIAIGLVTLGIIAINYQPKDKNMKKKTET